MLKKSSIKNRFNIDQDNSGEKLTSNYLIEFKSN